MADRSDKPTGMFWGLAGVVLFVLYLLSAGPVFWLCQALGSPRWMIVAMFIVYLPLLAGDRYGPPFFREWFNWYLEFWRQ